MDYAIRDPHTKRFPDDLNLILAIPQIGERDAALAQFLSPDDIIHQDMKIKTASGKAMQIPVRTSNGPGMFKIPPAGRRVSRRLGLKLMKEYGEHGKYRGRDRATGLNEFDIATLPAETIARLKGRHPDIEKFKASEDYLIHIPDKGMNDEIDELSTLVTPSGAALGA